ncbi:uncharacterized protein METZ01_LOCUS244387, partial [marine metagenome]
MLVLIYRYGIAQSRSDFAIDDKVSVA